MHNTSILTHAAAPYSLVDRLSKAMADPGLLAEVEELARTIATTRNELQRLNAGPFVAGHVPAATDELDEVVAHTAAATDQILQVCEELESAGGTATAEMLQRATTRIYEACSFQDITGQRITKVVATLKAIEGKVSQMLEVFGERPIGSAMPDSEPSLTNGPQLPANAMDQADIDKLLADF